MSDKLSDALLREQVLRLELDRHAEELARLRAENEALRKDRDLLVACHRLAGLDFTSEIRSPEDAASATEKEKT